jgi:uncharacterized protein YdhG (YjbR/CyaY superfamily)
MKIRFTILIYKRTLSVLGFDSTQRSFNINQNRFVKTNKLDVKRLLLLVAAKVI